MRFKVMAVLVFLWGLYMALSDGQFITPWFAILWGVLGAVALWQRRQQDGRIEHALPARVQFALALCLVVAALAATHWTDPGRRDLIQLGYTLFTAAAYGDGLAWAWSSVARAGRAEGSG
ncbi:MAG: hypothetical protein GX597_13825 [Anaerolineaceae bacterium]|nr:hypothetical protein [Anaerolineaceae bacterium]